MECIMFMFISLSTTVSKCVFCVYMFMRATVKFDYSFLCAIAGVDLHFGHESELPACQT